jgi:hypothetical protein
MMADSARHTEWLRCNAYASHRRMFFGKVERNAGCG